ncbi:MAG TPA: hypothetical protein VKD90_19390 [Gemmataceae bacterium]|nr:hypothetical protein [Gemmataceae bacterium]
MRRLIAFAALLAGVVLVGCTDKETPKAENKTDPTKNVAGKTPGPKHDGWWCKEHGIPEEECLMCLHSAADLKKKGDWCEHDFAKSQCFVCNPGLKARYAARYKDKYGKAPPEPDENPPAKNPEKK